jgi:Cof subfamily protein (haloacid dehalogenase superfamily)
MKGFSPKLIAVDMDGTLLNSAGELTDRTKAALQQAMSDGIRVVIATGRMYPSALPIILDIGTDSPCIFYNGAVVRNPATGATIYEKPVGVELTSEVVDYYHKHNWYIQLYLDDNLYVVDNNDLRCKLYESIARIRAVPMGERFWNFRVASTKLLGIAQDPEDFKKMEQMTRAQFGNRLYTATSWGAFVEMAHPEVNKANGVAAAAKYIGIKREDVLSIGDSGNDIEMIQWAGWGVAMGNSNEFVKNTADEIAPDNDHDGVAVIVERFLKQKKVIQI